MKDFLGKPGALRRLDPGARFVYAGFLIFLLVALAATVLLHVDGMGTATSTTAAWWRGDEAAMLYPKSYRQLLELTHFHLYTEPITWLVVAHLYALSGRARGWIIAGTLAAIGTQIALPWLVTYGGAGFAWLFPVVSIAVVIGLAFMAVAALKEMV